MAAIETEWYLMMYKGNCAVNSSTINEMKYSKHMSFRCKKMRAPLMLINKTRQYVGAWPNKNARFNVIVWYFIKFILHYCYNDANIPVKTNFRAYYAILYRGHFMYTNRQDKSNEHQQMLDTLNQMENMDKNNPFVQRAKARLLEKMKQSHQKAPVVLTQGSDSSYISSNGFFVQKTFPENENTSQEHALKLTDISNCRTTGQST